MPVETSYTVMMMRKSAIAAMILLSSLCAGQIPLGLHQAITIALSQRPELKAAAARVESAEQLRRQSGLFPNPRFIFRSENIRASDFNYGQDADTFAYASQVLSVVNSL